MKIKPTILSLALTVSITALLSNCIAAPTEEANTPPAEQETASSKPLTVAEAEQLAGFDIQEPGYLPEGVSFESATYQPSAVILSFKIVHKTYGDMGKFFEIRQEVQPDPPADVISCLEITEGCEMLQVNNMPVVYHLNPAGPEGLDWYANGFVFRLLRTAGEPNKVYRNDLIKIVESMK